MFRSLVTIFGYRTVVAVTPEPLAPLFAEHLKTLPARDWLGLVIRLHSQWYNPHRRFALYRQRIARGPTWFALATVRGDPCHRPSEPRAKSVTRFCPRNQLPL